MLTANEPSFIRAALQDVRARALEIAEQFPAIRHMVVFPPGQTIDLPHGGAGNEAALTPMEPPSCSVGTDGVNWNRVPIPYEWSGLPRVREIVVESKFGSRRMLRVHRFFGGGADTHVMDQLRGLAGGILELSAELDHAIFGKLSSANRSGQPPNTVFPCAGDTRDDNDRFVDEWLCTVHWWAWHEASLSTRTLPHVVHAGRIYPTSPDDVAVANKLSMSWLDADVFSATVATLDLFERFIGRPDDVFNAGYGYGVNAEPDAPPAVPARNPGPGDTSIAQAPARGEPPAVKRAARGKVEQEEPIVTDATQAGSEHIPTTKTKHPDHDARMELAGRYEKFREGKSRTAGSRRVFAEYESNRTDKTVTLRDVKLACDYARDK